MNRRKFISLVGEAAAVAWMLVARRAAVRQYSYFGYKTTSLLNIQQSQLFVELTTLDRAEAVAELIMIEQKRLEAAQQQPPFHRQPMEVEIATVAKELGLTRNVVRRSTVIAALSERAKVKAKRLRLDNNQTALYGSAKEVDPDIQVERLRQSYRRNLVMARVRRQGIELAI
jgi:hypothetical protein